MNEDMVKLLNSLIEVSPYSVLLVIITICYLKLFKVAIKAYKELLDKTMQRLEDGNKEVIKALEAAYKEKGE